VVIGDPQQLRHVSSIDERKEQEIAHSTGAEDLLSQYSYRKKSLFDCASETYEKAGRKALFLAEHYRSHPEIIEFSNRTYYRPNYKARLIVRTRRENTTDTPILWHDVPSEVDRPKGSLQNEREARKVVDLVRQIVTEGSLRDGWTMGIITPYNRQRNRIEFLLQQNGLLDRLSGKLRIGTVHTFQGSEADIIIFSPVVAEGADHETAEWISSEEGLLNVALTRARRVLHIVGDKTFCAQTRGDLGKLAIFVDELRGRKHSEPENSEARFMIRQMLANLGLWYQEEWPDGRYHLDFLVVGLSGISYDIEIDGRQHYFSAEAIAEDEARDAFLESRGYKVIRVRAVTADRYPDRVRVVLSRLA
jgi:very-short-patch-repair endonuclease